MSIQKYLQVLLVYTNYMKLNNNIFAYFFELDRVAFIIVIINNSCSGICCRITTTTHSLIIILTFLLGISITRIKCAKAHTISYG